MSEKFPAAENKENLIEAEKKRLGKNLDQFQRTIGEMPELAVRTPETEAAKEKLVQDSFDAWAKSRALFEKYFSVGAMAAIAPAFAAGVTMYFSPETQIPDVPASVLEYAGYISKLTQEQWGNLSQTSKEVHNVVAVWSNLSIGLAAAFAMGGIGKIQERIKRFQYRGELKENFPERYSKKDI